MSINEVRYLPECGSTNAYMKEHFEEFGPVGAVYTTNQTAGRGRLGRTWVNAEGKALYYTVAIREPLAQPATLPLLAQTAVSHVRAGADMVAPSDMMDGRVAAIRATLDSEALDDVSIMAYTAKYASALYGPFRGALESAPKEGDKKTYQMDPGNIREALREAQLDEAEGADILMVKPATLYLDVMAAMRKQVTLPIAAYHVSGEYLMIKSAAASGWLDERETVLETLISIRRAGADMILTYYAPQAAEWLQQR